MMLTCKVWEWNWTFGGLDDLFSSLADFCDSVIVGQEKCSLVELCHYIIYYISSYNGKWPTALKHGFH